MTLYRAARHRATIARLLSGKYIKRYESFEGFTNGLRFSNVFYQWAKQNRRIFDLSFNENGIGVSLRNYYCYRFNKFYKFPRENYRTNKISCKYLYTS